MPGSEKLAVLLFLGTVATLYVAAGGMLVRAAWARLTRRPRQLSRGHRWARRIVFGLAGAGLLCMAYGRFVEPRWLEVTRVRIESARLAGAKRPMRIVHLSDLHCDDRAGLEERLPDVVAGLRPDVIVFTGDAANNREGMERFRRCMARLAAIAPTLAVRGNWDGEGDEIGGLFGGPGATELDGEGMMVVVAGTEVWFAGAALGRAGAIDAALDAAPKGACKVLLYHYPDPILEVAARGDVDLQLSGHTHGGQVALPWYGALVTLSRHGKRFEHGLYTVGDTRLYVSRGIGMEGGPTLRVRFCARPEVTLIELVPPPA